MLNRLRLNWGFYESDISYFGGTVQYTGNVITKSYRSKLEEAIVTLRDSSCVVFMERFRKGNAAICKFVNNGTVVSRIEEYPDAYAFIEIMDVLTAHDTVFLEYAFMRRLKQYGTLFMQIACCLIVLLCVRHCILYSWSIGAVCISLVSFFLFGQLGALYHNHRIADPRKYKPIFFDDKR